MFIAREKEIQEIQNFLKGSGALLVYGLRRVGKTTLIRKVAQESKKEFVYFECEKGDEKTNVTLFTSLLKEQINFSEATYENFLQVFKELDRHYEDKIIIIDEYSLMKEYYLQSKKPGYRGKAEELDSEFQMIIDQHLGKMNLIISGSSIHIMKSLSGYASPLHGRFSQEIALSPFNYFDARKMLNDISKEDFVAYYSIFGGSPYVLERIDTRRSLKENICELLLDEDGKLRSYIKNNVISELENDPDLHDILDVIKNGAKKYGEIKEQAHILTPGLLDKRLNKLMELGIIETKFPIGHEEDKNKKYYQIKDSLLKFYYAYLFRQDSRIYLLSPTRYYETYIEPSLKGFVSRQFESIVRDYFRLAIQKGLYPEIVDIGSYFTGNSEFDCVLKKKNKKYTVYEVKYYSSPLKEYEQQKEIEQVKAIKGLEVDEIGFVCSAGFEKKIDSVTYLELRDLFFE